MSGLAYIAWALAICSCVGAAVFMITIDNGWWAAAFLVVAMSFSATAKGTGT